MKKKHLFGYAGTFILGSFVSGTVAMAATNLVQAQKKPSVIELNGKTISSPAALVYGGTTYVQLYSVQTGLQQVFGTKPTWDGTHFNIITTHPAPSTAGLTLANYGKIGSSDTVADVNKLFGLTGTLQESSSIDGETDTVYEWATSDDSKIVDVFFTNGNETDKDEAGLS